MVLQAMNNLKKEGSKEDKVAVASGIAISVVVILLVAWAIFFFRGIASGTQQIGIGGGTQSEFDFKSVREAQQAIQQSLTQPSADIQNVQSDQYGGGVPQNVQMQIQGEQTDQFGTSGQ